MPPLYDNIADAFALLEDGAEHTADFDNTGATFENNEETYGEGWPGVWAKIDLSGYYQPKQFTFQVAKISGTVVPYADFYYPIDATFNPANPDFTKLATIIGVFLGDGTDIPPAKTFEFGIGGADMPNDMAIPTIYVIFTDYNFTTGDEGVQRLTYTIELPPAPIVTVLASVDPNLSSPTVSTTDDGWVREEQIADNQNGALTTGPYPDAIPASQTATFYVRDSNLPPPGLYYVYAQVRMNGDNGSDGSTVALKRNGVPMMMFWDSDRPNDLGAAPGTPFTQYITYDLDEAKSEYTSQSSANPSSFPTTNPQIPTPTYAEVVLPRLAIAPGDVIEVVATSWEEGQASTDAIEIYSISFLPISEGGVAGPLFDIYDIADNPLGHPFTGDGLLQQTGFVNASASNYIWTVPSKSILILDSGDVYCIWFQSMGGVPLGGTSYVAGPYIAHYDGSSWVVDVVDLTGAGEVRTPNKISSGGAPEYTVASLDACTDGTSIYVAYYSTDDTHFPDAAGQTYHSWNMRVYVKKFTPGVGITDLGSIRAYGDRQFTPNNDYWGSPCIKVGNDGSLWVGFVEADDVVNSNFDYLTNTRNDLPPSVPPGGMKAFLAEWSGGISWVIHECEPPDDYNAEVYTPIAVIQAEADVLNGIPVSKTGPDLYKYNTGTPTETQTVVGHNQIMTFGSLPDPYSSAAFSFEVTVPAGLSTKNGFANVRVFSEGTSGSFPNVPQIAAYVNGVYKSSQAFFATTLNGTPTNSFGPSVQLSIGEINPGDLVQFKIGKTASTAAGYNSYADSVQLGYLDGVYLADEVIVDMQYQVCLVMCHHDGPNTKPAVIYNSHARRTDSTTIFARNQFVYSEWNGSAWQNTLKFLAQEVANENLISIPDQLWAENGDWGHWQQGMYLFDDGRQVYLAADLGYGNSWIDTLLVARLKTDGSEFECFTEFGASTVGGGWSDPGIGGALFDERKNLIVAYTCSEGSARNGANILAMQKDIGTGGWILASKSNNPPGITGAFQGFLRMTSKDDKLYIFDYWQRGNWDSFSTHSEGQLAVLVGTRTNNFAQGWAASLTSILSYYKDGVWHAANTEANRDLYYYSGGSWHKKGSELTQTVKAMSNESWTN